MATFDTIETIASRLPYGFEHVLAKPARQGVRPSVFARITSHVADFRERRATFVALTGMTSRELADIGLRRADIRRVFDAEFAAGHENARSAHPGG